MYPVTKQKQPKNKSFTETGTAHDIQNPTEWPLFQIVCWTVDRRHKKLNMIKQTCGINTTFHVRFAVAFMWPLQLNKKENLNRHFQFQFLTQQLTITQACVLAYVQPQFGKMEKKQKVCEKKENIQVKRTVDKIPSAHTQVVTTRQHGQRHITQVHNHSHWPIKWVKEQNKKSFKI